MAGNKGRVVTLLGLVFLMGLGWLVGLWIPRLILRTPSMEQFHYWHFSVWDVSGERRSAIELRTVLEDRG